MMGLDGRLDRLEQAFGVREGDAPCEKCGQSGDEPFCGRDREEILREVEREHLERQHVVDAKATAFPCPVCRRPWVLVMQTVDNWGERCA